jgi:ribosomal protein S14
MPRGGHFVRSDAIAAALDALAASDFDPAANYDNDRHPARCQVCGVRHAPAGVCGYCRYHVKRLRAEKGPVPA